MTSVAAPGGPLHVVVVNDRASPQGGASKVALTSAIGLAGRGHRVTLLAAQGPVDPDLVAAGVEVILLDQPDLASGPSRVAVALQGLWNPRAGGALRRIARSLPVGRTVIHVHSWSKALSPSVFAAARASGRPTLATLHDYGFVCPNAALHDFGLGQACQLKPMSIACLSRDCDSRRYVHKVWRIGRQVSLENVARAADAVDLAICVSDFSRDVYAPHLPPRLATRVVANPIDAEDRGPAAPASSDTFVYVGRLSREKGVLLLARAARLAGVRLRLVGEGELRDEIHALNPDAVVTGWVGAAEVVREMRGARALVLPAIWRETQGMVIPEAMANGIPCVASSGTAPGAAIQDGVTGRLFANGDAEALAEVLTSLATDDAAVSRMGQAAYAEFWSAPPTLERHLIALEAAYEAVLSGEISCRAQGPEHLQ